MSPTPSRPCVFCELLLGPRPAAQWDTVIFDTARYVVVPTKGALVPGWLLIVSKSHYLCAGALPAEEIEDLRQAVTLARSKVERHFGPTTIFEHGPVISGTPLGCGIDHLHFHAAPLQFSLTEAANSLIPELRWEKIGDFSELINLHKRRIGYAVVQEPGGELVWCRPPDNLRQMLRRAIAHGLNIPAQFDYSTHPHSPNVAKTVELLSAG